MRDDWDRQLEELRALSVNGLRGRYEELFGEPSRSRHRRHLLRRIAWRLQVLREGDSNTSEQTATFSMVKTSTFDFIGTDVSTSPRQSLKTTKRTPLMHCFQVDDISHFLKSFQLGDGKLQMQQF